MAEQCTNTESKNPLAVVIDDDYDALEWCKVILELDGFTVACFYDSNAALDYMLHHKPDVIISDLMMADLDSGFEFAEKIKKTPKLSTIPIIIITAAASRHGFDFTPRSEADLKSMHIDAFFSKPADPKALIGKIHELMAKTPTKSTSYNAEEEKYFEA